jgi:hypothetical protein
MVFFLRRLALAHIGRVLLTLAPEPGNVGKGKQRGKTYFRLAFSGAYPVEKL